MRSLIILRGAPGCGKSTFIKNNKLEPYTISTDDLRLQFMYSYSGSTEVSEISQEYNGKVFKYLNQLLELRMSFGLYTIIDATHSTTREINSYKSLVERYNYHAFVIDFTDLPIEECKRRNASREAFRRVPEEVIDRMYHNFEQCEVPSYVKVIKPEEFDKISTVKSEVKLDDIDEVIDNMRSNPCVAEKSYGNISSFNFTREAFYSGVWDNQTIVARGLYINTKLGKIVARGFNKFFNIGEMESTQLGNLKTMKFPVTCYVKENGYLGLASYNEETDDLFVTTKSSPEGDFSVWLREAIERNMTSENIEKMKNFSKNENVTFVFENVDMKNDPHIIDYAENQLFLIAIIKNKMDFEQLPYEQLVDIAKDLGLKYKTKACVIDTYEEFVDWYKTVTANDYLYEGRQIEGFVVEAADGYMVKVKLAFYKFWKFMRSIAQGTLKYGKYKREDLIEDELALKFYEFCKKLYNENTAEKRDLLPRDAVTLRKMFYAETKS